VILVGGSGLYMNAVLYGIDALPDPDPGLRRHLDQLLEKEGITRLQQMLLGLDPDYYSEVDKKNPKRLQRAIEVCMLTGQPYSALRLNHPKTRPFRAIRIGLEIGRAQLNERINLRVDRMVAEGLVEEVRSLYPYRHLNALNTVGYRELFPYFDGLISLDQAIDQIKRNTRKYAKRQMTWFRKDKQFKWFNPDDTEAIVDYIRNS
jgi:tRNA dimethylallyltransferase